MNFARLPITSAQNPRFKQVLKLQSNRGRKTIDRIIIFGAREVSRALASRWQLTELWICGDHVDNPEVAQMLNSLSPSHSGLTILEAPGELFERLEFGQRHEGVLAVAVRPSTELAAFTPRPPQLAKSDSAPLVLIVEGIEKPGNLGAVLRSADGAGVHGVIHANPQTDFFHPNAIRASMGTVMHLPLATASTPEVIDWLNARQFELCLASLAGSVDYAVIDYQRPTAIVLGTEATGLSAAWYQTQHRAIRLPMLGVADSLNISVAAAVIMYEARRQRGATTPIERDPNSTRNPT